MYVQGSEKSFKFRLAVPSRLRDIIGQREFKYSIPAASKIEAALIGKGLASTLQALFVEIESGEISMNTVDIPALVREYIKEGLDRLQEYQDTGPSMTPGEFDDRQLSLSLLRSDIRSYLNLASLIMSKVWNLNDGSSLN